MRVRSIVLLVLALALTAVNRTAVAANWSLSFPTSSAVDQSLMPAVPGEVLLWLADIEGGMERHEFSTVYRLQVAGTQVAASPGGQGGGRPCSDLKGGYYYLDSPNYSPWFPLNALIVHHVLADGTEDPAWPASDTVSSAVSFNPPPRCVADTGGVYVAYVASSSTLRLNRYDSHGALVRSFLLPGYVAPLQWEMVADARGAAVVVFPYAATLPSVADIVAYRMRPNGMIFASPMLIASSNTSVSGAFDDDPAVVATRAGTDIGVAWYAWSLGAASAARVDLDGNALAADSVLAGLFPLPRVCSDTSGGLYVAGLRPGSPPAFQATRLSSDLSVSPGWSKPGASIMTPAAVVSGYAQVGDDGRGGMMAAWLDVRGVSTASICARDIAADGTTPADWPSEGASMPPVPLSTVGPSIVLGDGAGRAFVFWGASTLSRLEPPGFVSVPAPPAVASAALRAWPNPARGELRVALARADRGAATLELIDVSGRLVRRAMLDAREGEVRWSLGADVRPGLYVVRAIAAGRALTARVAVLR